jgi:hypothetical protein
MAFLSELPSSSNSPKKKNLQRKGGEEPYTCFPGLLENIRVVSLAVCMLLYKKG